MCDREDGGEREGDREEGESEEGEKGREFPMQQTLLTPKSSILGLGRIPAFFFLLTASEPIQF